MTGPIKITIGIERMSEKGWERVIIDQLEPLGYQKEGRMVADILRYVK